MIFLSLENDNLAYLGDLKALETKEAPMDDPDTLDITRKDLAARPVVADVVSAADINSINIQSRVTLIAGEFEINQKFY